jgi:hypothetical protein
MTNVMTPFLVLGKSKVMDTVPGPWKIEKPQKKNTDNV